MVCEVPASCDSSYCDDDPRDCDLHHLPVLQEGRFSYRMSDHLLCDLHLPSSDPLRAGSSEQGETDGRYHSCDAWSLHDGYRYGSFSSGIKHPFILSLTHVLTSLFRCLCQQTIPHLCMYLFTVLVRKEICISKAVGGQIRTASEHETFSQTFLKNLDLFGLIMTYIHNTEDDLRTYSAFHLYIDELVSCYYY